MSHYAATHQNENDTRQESNLLLRNENYTRRWSNLLLTVKVVVETGMGEAMVARVNNKSDSDAEKSQLSKQDVRLLLVMCIEFVNLCAKLTGKTDPAAAAMLAYVRDDIVAESKLEMQ